MGSFLQREGTEEQKDTMEATGWERNTHWQGKKEERGRPSVIEGRLFRGEKNRATETAMKPEEEGHGPPCHPDTL